MGNYNFETAPNRIGQHTYKWKEAEKDSQVLQPGLRTWILKSCLKSSKLYMITLIS